MRHLSRRMRNPAKLQQSASIPSMAAKMSTQFGMRSCSSGTGGGGGGAGAPGGGNGLGGGDGGGDGGESGT